jgi:hypothetical protein
MFVTDFQKILKYQISCKSVQWKMSCSYGWMDRKTDMTKLIVTFYNFANMPKNTNNTTYSITLNCNDN